MMGPEGDTIQADERTTCMVEEHEVGYSELPTVDVVDSTIDRIIETPYENNKNRLPSSQVLNGKF